MASNPSASLQTLQISSPVGEIYSRKVFLGGLPFDITEQQIVKNFEPYGELVVDWPKRPNNQKATFDRTSNTFPGYVFIIFHEEASVRNLIEKCYNDKGKYFTLMSSSQTRNKPVQVRPWKLEDAEYIPHPQDPLDVRRVVFVGGLPRTSTAHDLAFVMQNQFGKVIYAGVDVDPELKYPKGAGRVAFASYKSYIDAMRGKFIKLPGESKQAEIKPYVVEEQQCDQCKGALCGGRYAPFFCGYLSCLQYYCEICWEKMHFSDPKRRLHVPFKRLGETYIQNMN